MADTFLHGVEVVEVDSGARPIRTERTNTVGVLGLAYQGPANEPVEISDPTEAVDMFGAQAAGATLPAALAAVQSQIQPRIVAVNALDPAVHKTDVADEDQTLVAGAATLAASPIVRDTVVVKDSTSATTYDEGDDYTIDLATGALAYVAAGAIGATEALKISYSYWTPATVTTDQLVAAAAKFAEAESALGLRPKILVAPGHTDTAAVVTGMLAAAEDLRAIVIADGPSTTDAAAITYRNNFSSRRVYLVDPEVKIPSGSTTVDAPASGRVAGVIVRSDAERGFWWSPSNRAIAGISGLGRAVSFALGDPDASANLLNENEIATIVRREGFRLWGNRTCSSDPKWAFLSVVRTADAINEALLRAHLWAIDRNLTKTYVEDVAESVNDYLRGLQAQGAILGGRCVPDADRNTAAARAAGRVYFSFDFTPPTPAERITFRSAVVDDYVEAAA